MISGLVVLSDAIKGCYPFIESITSFLPVVDEMVVVINPYGTDNTEEVIRETFKDKVRVVHAAFNIRKYGWQSYAISRTTGYQACKGDVVMMFDADGILHEKDVELCKLRMDQQAANEETPSAYWLKHRIYKPDLYWEQKKHSGIYTKKFLGDHFDFYHPDGRGIPNWTRTDVVKSRQLDITLFGYEHVWDTKEMVMEKATRYGRMADKHAGRPLKADEEYFSQYIKDLKTGIEEKGKKMDISAHPKIIKDRLINLDESHFGYNFFNA